MLIYLGSLHLKPDPGEVYERCTTGITEVYGR